MKIAHPIIFWILVFPLLALAGKETKWDVIQSGRAYTITPDTKHAVQDRSVSYLPEAPVDIRNLEEYSITLAVASSKSDWNEAGLVFGGNEGDFHFFLINSNEKYYSYGVHESTNLHANWKDFLYRFKSDEIELTQNEIRIQKRSNRLEFYINGKRVAQSEPPKLNGSKIGYYLRGEAIFKIKKIELRIE